MKKKKCNCNQKQRNKDTYNRAKMQWGDRITEDMMLAYHDKGCPLFICPSTHGGLGYTVGDYRDKEGNIICVICGEKCIDNKIAAKQVVDHIYPEKKHINKKWYQFWVK